MLENTAREIVEADLAEKLQVTFYNKHRGMDSSAFLDFSFHLPSQKSGEENTQRWSSMKICVVNRQERL